VFSPYVTNSALTTEFYNQEAFANIVIVNDTLMLKTGNSVTWMDRDGNILYRCADPNKHGLAMSPWQVRYWQNRLLVLDYKNGMPKCYAIDPVTHQFYWSTIMSENDHDYHSFVLCPPPSFVGDNAYFLSDNYWIIGIDVMTGQRKYAMDLSRAVYDKDDPNQSMEGGFLVDENHHIYVMDNKYIYCLQMKQ
jgi:hypothetical protein